MRAVHTAAARGMLRDVAKGLCAAAATRVRRPRAQPSCLIHQHPAAGLWSNAKGSNTPTASHVASVSGGRRSRQDSSGVLTVVCYSAHVAATHGRASTPARRPTAAAAAATGAAATTKAAEPLGCTPCPLGVLRSRRQTRTRHASQHVTDRTGERMACTCTHQPQGQPLVATLNVRRTGC